MADTWDMPTNKLKGHLQWLLNSCDQHVKKDGAKVWSPISIIFLQSISFFLNVTFTDYLDKAD